MAKDKAKTEEPKESEEEKSKDYTPTREFVDLLAGAAFPFIIQLVFSSTIMVFANSMDDLWIQILAFVVGEALLVAAYIMFGRRSGGVAYSRFVTAQKIRDDEGNPNFRKAGEYKLYKGFLIGFISVVPCLIVHLFFIIFEHNSPCEFMMQYIFSWEYSPVILYLASKGMEIGEVTRGVSSLALLVTVVYVVIHGVSYYFGMKKEMKKQEVIRIADEARAKEFEQMELERQERAERMRQEAAKHKKKK